MRFRRVDPALFPVSGAPRRAAPRDAAARERLARRVLAHWADGTLPEAAGLVTEDLVIVATDAAGQPLHVRGLTALAAHAAAARAHPGRTPAEALVGPTAVAFVHAGRDGAPGALSHFSFRDGRVAAVRVFRAAGEREA